MLVTALSVKKNSSKPVALVTGAASFLGAAICEVLLSQNCQVVAVDNLQTGKKENLGKLFERSDFIFLEFDINFIFPENLSTFDYIFHLAGVDEYLSGFDLTLENLLINSRGTENLLELAKKTGAKFLLVSTLDVYSGILSSLSLEHYFGKTQIEFSKFSHHEAARFAENLAVAYFEKYNLDIRIVRVEHVYGPAMSLAAATTIADLFNSAVFGENLRIFGDGTEILHPTFVSDVVYGIVKAVFSPQTKGKIFNLVNPNEITVLEFSNSIKKVVGKLRPENPIEIVFDKRKHPPKFPIHKIELEKSQSNLGWSARVLPEEGIEKTLNFFWSQIPTEKEQPPLLEGEQPVETLSGTGRFISRLSLQPPKLALASLVRKLTLKWKLVLPLLIFLAIVSWFIFLPAGQIFIGGFLANRSLSSSRDQFLAQNFSAAAESAKKAVDQSQLALNGWLGLNKILLAGKAEGLSQDLNFFLSGAQNLGRAAVNLSEVAELALPLANQVAAGSEVMSVEKISDQISHLLSDSAVSLQLAQLQFSQVNLPFVQRQLEYLGQTLPKVSSKVAQLTKLVAVLPELIGSGGSKSYLILLQNNLELRPGGGFIGSYGILTFKNGASEEILIDDVYNLDGQIKINIPPPAPLEKYLGVTSWFLRDSNWSPDSLENARVAAEFYQDAIGGSVDGVIAIDVSAVAGLIEALGPVHLSDYDETITAENLAERAEYYSEIGFFPGSTSKKDFLSSLARKLVADLQDPTVEKDWLKISAKVAKAAAEKHILFFFPNEKLGAFFADANLSGILPSVTSLQNGEVVIESDFLAISEANVGANKANRFLTRQIELRPVIQRDGDLISAVKIIYQNQSPAATWPGGTYKNYLRILTPLGSKVEAVNINGNTDLSTVELSTLGEDKQVWAVFLEVAAGQTAEVEFKYRLSYRTKISEDTATYNLLVQKQPGTEDDQINLELSFPGYLKFEDSNPAGKLAEQKITFSQQLTSDKQFKVDFSF